MPRKYVADWRQLAETKPVGQTGLRKAVSALALAAIETPLGDFYPFTSVNRLCFATTPYPFESIQMGYIGFSRTGEFAVLKGDPYGDDPRFVMETSDADEAVQATLCLLGLQDESAVRPPPLSVEPHLNRRSRLPRGLR